MQNLKDFTFTGLEELMAEIGEKPYRAGQVRKWIYQKQCCSVDKMTDLSKPLREKLSQSYSAGGLESADRRESKDGTVKYLFRLDDGQTIETVFIPEKSRGTVCISTQVGCKFGCRFCATGMQGFRRNLSLGEILNQIIEVQKNGRPERVTNIVFMGMGEPLDNFYNVTEAVKIINSPEGFNIGVRRITLSTAGLTPEIKRLGELDLNINLAISLHSADGAVRSQLMPINKKYPVAGLLEACAGFPLKPQRKITMEVILFDGVNDTPEQAKKMVKALHSVKAKVNLITFNDVEGNRLKCSSPQKVREFQKRLTTSGLNATIRSSKGGEINAACGQLKSLREQ